VEIQDWKRKTPRIHSRSRQHQQTAQLFYDFKNMEGIEGWVDAKCIKVKWKNMHR
jgi:hypothetical protein